MEIIVLTPDDWALFRDLRFAALCDAPEAFGSTVDHERTLGEADWRKKLANRTQFGARAGGDVIGMVGGCRDGEIIEVVSMWVNPRARQRGVGSALVERVIAHGRAVRARELRLWVSAGNHRAERLYERHGFVRTGLVQPLRVEGTQLEAEWALELG